MKIVLFENHEVLADQVAEHVANPSLLDRGVVFQPEVHWKFLRGQVKQPRPRDMDTVPEFEQHPSLEYFNQTITYACLLGLNAVESYLEAWVSLDVQDGLFVYPKKVHLYLVINEALENSVFFQPKEHETSIMGIIRNGLYVDDSTKEQSPALYTMEYWKKEFDRFLTQLVSEKHKRALELVKEATQLKNQLLYVKTPGRDFFAPIGIIGAFIFLKILH